jgi:signal transduction histidine kinase
VLVVVLAAASMLIVRLVDQQLSNDLRQQNQATLASIAERITDGVDPRALQLPAGTDGTEFIVETLDGQYVNSTQLSVGELEALEFDLAALEELPDFFDEDFIITIDAFPEVVIVDSQDFEIESIDAVAANGETFVVSALTTSVVIDRNVDQVRSVLWLVIPALAVFFGLLIWLLTGRVLRPVDAMTRKAARISTETLHERLDQPGTSDEIDRLAATLNSMLDRLDQGATLQKQFVSDASHELRSPLTVLLGEAELARSSNNPEQLAATNELVIAQAGRMNQLIDDLLHLARTGEAIPDRVDVDVDDVLRREAKQQPRPIDTSGVEPARVRGDLRGIDRVVRNLLDNACRHAASAIRVTSTTNDEFAQLTVEDDGPGVPAGDRDRIFERFARLDEARNRTAGGTGLGLAIVKAIVDVHNGTITVDESPLGGARFSVQLPTEL